MTGELINMMKIYTTACRAKHRFVSRINEILIKEDGATIAEYAILLAVVVVALIAILGQLTQALESKLQSIIDQISSEVLSG